MVGRWTPEYNTYFMVNINPEIRQFSLWLAREIGFPVTENSIFQSNACEHLNFLAAALQNFKEVPLHHMHTSYLSNAKRNENQ